MHIVSFICIPLAQVRFLAEGGQEGDLLELFARQTPVPADQLSHANATQTELHRGELQDNFEDDCRCGPNI